MLHELTYSLKAHIETQVNGLSEVVWMYNGVQLTGKELPFATVEHLQTGNENLSKERRYYEETYHFQIGLFSDSDSQLKRLSDKIKRALRQPTITLYDTSESEPKESGSFYAELQTEESINSHDIADETRMHRIYYDIEIVVNETI